MFDPERILNKKLILKKISSWQQNLEKYEKLPSMQRVNVKCNNFRLKMKE